MGSSSFFPPGVGEGGGGMMSPPAHLCFFLCFLGRLHKALSKFCFSSVLQTFCRHLCFRMRVPDSPPGAEERGQGYLKHMGWELFGFIKASFFFFSNIPCSCFLHNCYLVSKKDMFQQEKRYLLQVKSSGRHCYHSGMTFGQVESKVDGSSFS